MLWMPLHQIPRGFSLIMLAVATQFTTRVEHPTLVTTRITTWVTTQQLLPAEHDKWRVGNVEPLQAQEESPFIGQLDPGKHQLAIETGMYRAPGFAYTTPPTDFLLIRNATGAMSLRELTGCFAVGQQVPAMRAPVPGSRDVR